METETKQQNSNQDISNNTIKNRISEDTKERWREVLRQIPVAVNNFYGDPILQWENTLEKLDALKRSQHKGPIGIILKGRMNEKHIQDLKKRKEAGLNLVCLISISELTKMEGTGSAHRYENIRLLNEANIPAIAYIRPMIPPFNTSEEVIGKIFSNLKRVGCKVAVASGFRGDEELVSKLAPDDQVEWAMRVKILPAEIYQRIKMYAEKSGVQLFTRTACGVAYITGAERTYNPYYNSPNLVKCEELNCPLRSTCGPLTEPRKDSLELARALGFDVEFVQGSGQRLCKVKGENRLKCPSCCTTCYFSKGIPHIVVRGKVNLGCLAFIRFITGVMSIQDNLRDDGSKDVGKLNFSNYPQINNAQALNSWWVFSRNLDRCFGCKYCVVREYYNKTGNNVEVGFPPAELVDMMFKN